MSSWLTYLLTAGLWNVWINMHACMVRKERNLLTRDIGCFIRGTTDRNRSYFQMMNPGNLPQSGTLIYSDWLTTTWIHVTRVWMNSPPAGWFLSPIRGKLMLNGFCPIRLLPCMLSWSSASQRGLPNERLSTPTHWFFGKQTGRRSEVRRFGSFASHLQGN